MEMGMLASGRQPPDAATIKWEKKTIRNQAQHLALSDRLAKIASCQCQHATYHSKHTWAIPNEVCYLRKHEKAPEKSGTEDIEKLYMCTVMLCFVPAEMIKGAFQIFGSL